MAFVGDSSGSKKGIAKSTPCTELNNEIRSQSAAIGGLEFKNGIDQTFRVLSTFACKGDFSSTES